MTPTDLISAWQECSHLSQSQINRFLAAGVSIDALSADPDDYGFAVATDLVAFDGCQFAFERHLRQPGECERAFIVPARDQFGEIADLVAWRGERLATWCGSVGALGLQNIYAPRLSSNALSIAANALDWLRNERRGVVIVYPMRAKWELASAGPLCAANVSHGLALREALTFSPEIVVPPSSIGLAA